MDVVIEGPGKNCLSSKVMDTLLAKLQDAAGAPVLLTGAGDVFCAGLDLKELGSLDALGIERYLRKLEALVEALYAYPGPLVACVNGHAIAGGCVLAMCCDHQVATTSPKVKIGLNELALGVRFPPVTLAVICERLPKRHLNQVLLGAQLFDPATALRMGLVDELADDPMAAARERLSVMASHPSASFSATKAELRRATLDAKDIELRFHEMLPAWVAPETKRRIGAALK